MMSKKIQAIADTHGRPIADEIEECDILIIAGDISPVWMDHSFHAQRGWFETNFISDLKECKAKANHIVFVGGNHDTYLAEMAVSGSKQVNILLPDDVHYLCDESIEIEGIKIYGTPWCVLPKWADEGPPVWNFARSDEALEAIYSTIPNGIDILVTHGPAYRFCDAILEPRGYRYSNTEPEPLGSKSLLEAISKLDQKPKFVLSGHIHSAQREFEVYQPQVPGDKVKFSCCSILNEEYKFCDSQSALIINL